MTKCDCLNHCGDDLRVRNDFTLRCESYDRLNRYSNDSHDAMLFRTINENLDAAMLEKLVKAYEEKDLTKRYQMLQSYLISVARGNQVKKTHHPTIAY